MKIPADFNERVTELVMDIEGTIGTHIDVEMEDTRKWIPGGGGRGRVRRVIFRSDNFPVAEMTYSFFEGYKFKSLIEEYEQSCALEWSIQNNTCDRAGIARILSNYTKMDIEEERIGFIDDMVYVLSLEAFYPLGFPAEWARAWAYEHLSTGELMEYVTMSDDDYSVVTDVDSILRDYPAASAYIMDKRKDFPTYDVYTIGYTDGGIFNLDVSFRPYSRFGRNNLMQILGGQI